MTLCNPVLEVMFHHCWCLLFISWKSLVLAYTLGEGTVHKDEYQKVRSLVTTLEAIFYFLIYSSPLPKFLIVFVFCIIHTLYFIQLYLKCIHVSYANLWGVFNQYLSCEIE